ncbi:MAG TPA: hypothetical protein VIM57_02940 [Luteolibacter sp.]
MNAHIHPTSPGNEPVLARIGVEDCCRGSDDDLAIHERAADVMIGLRKKGVLAHLEKRVDASGEHVDIVKESQPESTSRP